MNKGKFQVRTITGLEEVEGEECKIDTPGNFKFAVVYFENSWRVTELSTGFAVPGSFADNKEDSIQKAIESINKVNDKHTYLEGIIKGIQIILNTFKI